MNKVRRDYKNTVFLMLCRDKERLLRIYNAMNGTCYTNAEDLEITTLENAIFMNMKNDVSFIFDCELNLYEHQSTVNPNMPLRDLFYVSKVLQKLVKDYDLYSSKLVKIPTPRFVVLYNGTKEQPERYEQKLSDAFLKKMGVPQLELIVTVININPGYNKQLMEDCRDLREYTMYIERVRGYMAKMPIQQAVERAVEECIAEGILAEFLLQNKAEVIEVSIFEYNEELHFAGLRQEGYEEGESVGRAAGRLEGLKEGRLQILIDMVKEGLLEMEDAALRCEMSVEEFNERM